MCARPGCELVTYPYSVVMVGETYSMRPCRSHSSTTETFCLRRRPAPALARVPLGIASAADGGGRELAQGERGRVALRPPPPRSGSRERRRPPTRGKPGVGGRSVPRRRCNSVRCTHAPGSSPQHATRYEPSAVSHTRALPSSPPVLARGSNDGPASGTVSVACRSSSKCCTRRPIWAMLSSRRVRCSQPGQLWGHVR